MKIQDWTDENQERYDYSVAPRISFSRELWCKIGSSAVVFFNDLSLYPLSRNLHHVLHITARRVPPVSSCVLSRAPFYAKLTLLPSESFLTLFLYTISRDAIRDGQIDGYLLCSRSPLGAIPFPSSTCKSRRKASAQAWLGKGNTDCESHFRRPTLFFCYKNIFNSKKYYLHKNSVTEELTD